MQDPGKSGVKATEQIFRYSLHARIWAAWPTTVGLWEEKAGRGTQANGPPNRGSVEYEIAFRPWINRRGILDSLGPAAAKDRAPGKNFEIRYAGGFAVVFPTDQAGNRIAIFHSRAFVKPVLVIHARPVGSAIVREG